MTGRLVMSRAQGVDLQNLNLQSLETGAWVERRGLTGRGLLSSNSGVTEGEGDSAGNGPAPAENRQTDTKSNTHTKFNLI